MKTAKYVLAFAALLFTALGSSTPAHADTITYTFTGTGNFAGTDFTYVSPSGFLSFPPSNIQQILTPTTATDLITVTGDFGPITGFSFGVDDLGFQTGGNIGINSGVSLQPYSLNVLGSQTLTDNPGAIVGTLAIAPVPEPSSLLLLGTGLLGLAGAMRRKWLA